ncbi:DHH family phosphoesterase [Virgibacillus sp. AGTR]|uniref:single-stranded-DNA-specific exonuclease RecJ n=1 Tax=Virgibacillus sp. AGTR TaxID=2812055 RepID=UPI001D16616B|nr:DHH family phosphoesterase [Virgibacillus sp. AGTR]MCC2248911.1 DHH family phosphoesterase [Virgibacillus sp. AGTR]
MTQTQIILTQQMQNPIIHSFLHRRDLTTQDVTYLLNPNETHQHDPFLLKGVGRWIDVLHSVKGHSIAIIPDYDADGVLSGTLARVGLSLFGFGDAYLYPPKTRDGYGLSKKSIDNVLQARPDISVIVTTDNGSNAHDGVLYAKEKGLIVLVTDHHLAEHPPCADAVVNPNGHGDNTYPFTHISGTAVIYKTLAAYAHKYVKNPDVWHDFHSLVLLVGISTISDVMPLVNENRYYVKESVRMLTYFIEGYSVGRVLGYDDTPLHQYYRGVDLLVTTLNQHGKLKYGIDADTFGFIIGPMLNSPRRMMGESELSFQLFQSKRSDIADTRRSFPSDDLFVINEQRKVYVQMLTTALFSYMKEHGGRPLDYMIFNARMREGIAGLLSGNFTKKFGLPSIAFGLDEGMSQNKHDRINVDITGRQFLTGSARSPETFDLHGFLTDIDTAYPGLIEKWGGHAQAAGITIRAEKYDQFRAVFTSRFIAVMAEQMTHQEESSAFNGEYVLTTDAYDRLMQGGATHKSEVVPLHRNTSVFTNQTLWDAVRFFEQLEPFGNGFPRPSFSVAIAMQDVSRIFYMGAEKQHAKLMLSNGLTVIQWNGAKLFARPEPVETDKEGNPAPDDRMFVVTGTLGINRFNGDESLQLIATDVCDITPLDESKKEGATA